MFKVISKWLVKFLVLIGLINIIFKVYGKFGKFLFKDVLDSVIDDEELKVILVYIFGDYGNILFLEFFNFIYLFFCLSLYNFVVIFFLNKNVYYK